MSEANRPIILSYRIYFVLLMTFNNVLQTCKRNKVEIYHEWLYALVYEITVSISLCYQLHYGSGHKMMVSFLTLWVSIHIHLDQLQFNIRTANRTAILYVSCCTKHAFCNIKILPEKPLDSMYRLCFIFWYK